MGRVSISPKPEERREGGMKRVKLVEGGALRHRALFFQLVPGEGIRRNCGRCQTKKRGNLRKKESLR